MIQRAVVQRILDDLTFFPAVGIIGPRQVGKTTLAKSLQNRLSIPSEYLDLELNSHIRRLDDAETYLRSLGDRCVIIDEIQRRPDLFPLLRALIDEDRRPARFLILGSASPEMIRGSSESLAGRIAYTELTPFSIREIHTQYKQADHWLKGGFPPALLAPGLPMTWRWIESFISTFIERDLRELGKEVSGVLLSRLLSMISHVHAGVQQYSDLSRSLGITVPTVKRYLDILEGTFIVRRLQPYYTNAGKRLVKSPKLYFRDSGLLHYLSEIRDFDQLHGHIIVGASWEGYVIEEISRHIPSDWQMFFYRTHTGAEADLVLIAPRGKKICIEIKYSNAPVISKGFYQSVEDLKPDHQYIIIPSGERYVKDNNLIVCNLREFVLKEVQGI